MKRFQHTVALTTGLDCEEHLCGRCAFRTGICLGHPGCNLFREPTTATKKGHARRLPECKAAEVRKP